MKTISAITSVFLASLMLVVSTGVTINLHLCADKIQSIALFVKAQPCKDVKKPCHGTEHHAKHNGCCEDESIVIKSQEVNAAIKTPTQLTPSFQLVAVVLPVLYSIHTIDLFIAAPRYVHYKPPLLGRDINVLFHSFLI